LINEKKVVVNLKYYQIVRELQNKIDSYGQVSNIQFENYDKLTNYRIYSIRPKKERKMRRKLNKYCHLKNLNKIKKSNSSYFLLTNYGILKINGNGLYNDVKPWNQYANDYNRLIKKFGEYLTEPKLDTIKKLTGLDTNYFYSQKKLRDLEFQDYLDISIQLQIENSERNKNQKSFLFWKLSSFGQLNGNCGELNHNNQPLWTGNYNNGNFNGKWIAYDPVNNVIKGIRTYDSNQSYTDLGACDVFKQVPYFSSLNKDHFARKFLSNSYFKNKAEISIISSLPDLFERIYDDEEFLIFSVEDAEYPGGYSAMMKYIQDHLYYPPSAIELGIQGKVTLKFVVEKNGQVSNVSVVRGIPGCADCDKEAVKVVSNMPNWKPAKTNGINVRQWNTLPISFALD
jgi:TonB family protein